MDILNDVSDCMFDVLFEKKEEYRFESNKSCTYIFQNDKFKLRNLSTFPQLAPSLATTGG